MRKKKSLLALIVFTLIMIFMIESGSSSKAASTENIDIRFVFTTDLHGRLTTMNYEQNKAFNTGSLAKAATLIRNARSEKADGNTFTFDIGDVLYDYTTEAIFELKPEEIQPIYKAMATLDYDAITLGNHEFEYGYDYLMDQLQGSRLKDITVVSNLIDAKTGKAAFHENMILTRKVKTNSGSTATVKIGVIGETIPTLSKKRENFTGIFQTEDIVANTAKQAKALKAKGADVIVVLAHSGFGVENPLQMSNDVSYALTKIPEVDVVLCGHEHKIFPSNSADSALFYELPGVDKDTGLVNGKNLVMANDKGQSVGVVDLTIEKSSNQTEVVDRSSEVRKVTANTATDASLNKGYDGWEDLFTTNSKNVIGNVASGKSINNYFGLVEDSSSIQLVNNAMINYALQFVNTTGKQYKNYPIVAASNHVQYGQYLQDDYVRVNGQITEANMSSIATFHRYIYLYEVTGKQLREWIEWSASAYETTNQDVKWTDGTMNRMMEASGAKSLIAESWINDWSSFYVFDGIEYTINPFIEPKYNSNGEIINQTNRVGYITYNGKPITDDMKFVLAAQSLSNVKFSPIEGIGNQIIKKGATHRLNVLLDYVKQLCKVEDLVPTVDNNWNIALPKDKSFILRSSQNATINKDMWNYSIIDTLSPNVFYKVQYQLTSDDRTGPNVVLASTNNANTNNNVDIAVNANDSSGIKVLKYTIGDYDKDSYVWSNGTEIDDKNVFTVTNNGVYTVYAEDNAGNKAVSKIKIDNINRDILQVPTINSYTNRMTKMTGTAEPGAVVYCITEDGTYHAEVDTSGSFSCPLPTQRAKDTVTVYVEDEYGRRSAKVTVVVKRTGPNYPEISGINNNDVKIIGNTDDSIKTVFAVVGEKVYVSSKGGLTAYKNCEKYSKDKKIVTTNVSVGSDGSFSMSIPAFRSSTSVTVYSLDYVGRVSKANKIKVAHAAPNPPTLYETCNAEKEVHGRVYTATTGTIYDVNVTVGGKTYRTTTDENGYFVTTVGNLKKGETIAVYATDTVDNTIRKSAKIQTKVKDVKEFVSSDDDYKYVEIYPVTDKTDTLTGQCDDTSVKVTLKVNGVFYDITTDEEGYFELPLEEKLEIGTSVSAVVRVDNGGIIGADLGSVVLGKPYQPILINPNVYNTTGQLTVATTEKCKITVKVASKSYTTSDGYYDYDLKSYCYDIKIKNVNSGNDIIVYATNAAGSSPKLTRSVIQKAPNTPKTASVDTNSKVIKGTVNLILEDALIEAGQQPTVANTETKVYAKIGSKTYKAVIEDDGTFAIKIPKQKEKTSITIWASNAQGRGPTKAIKVVKAKSK